MSQLEKVQQSFQRSLTSYDQHAYVQAVVAENLHDFLLLALAQENSDLALNNVLELGCGTGFLTKKIVNTFDVNFFTANDLLSACETLVADSLSNMVSDWQFLAGDVELLSFPENLDLVCSSSVLQWVRDVPNLLDRLGTNMNTGAWLALSSFGPNHFSELRDVQHQLQQEYALLNYVSESQWSKLLSEHFEVKFIKTERRTQWFDSVEALLQHLRKTGVNGNARQQWSQVKMQEFQVMYEKLYAKDNKTPLSYEPIYIVARKHDSG